MDIVSNLIFAGKLTLMLITTGIVAILVGSFAIWATQLLIVPVSIAIVLVTVIFSIFALAGIFSDLDLI